MQAKKLITRKSDVIEEYHGTRVADPYRWLEDAEAGETRAWVEEQNAATFAFLAQSQEREHIKERLTELMDYPKYSVPVKRGTAYFFSKNTGLQNQAVLYVQEGLDGEPRVLLDPNTLSEDGTVALTSSVLSEDGSLLAYSLSSSGSDRQDIHIRRVVGVSDFPEVLRWCKFSSVAWKHDNSGFFYNRFPEPGTVPEEDQNNFNRVYWHTLGTVQEEDRLVYEEPEHKELGFDPFITRDGQYLLLRVWHGTDPKNRIYYREVESSSPFIHLLDDADAMYSFVGNTGPIFYFHTNQDAPRGRLIAIDIRQPGRQHWQELVPQQDDVLDFALIVNQQFVLVYMHDAHHEVKRYNLAGQFLGEVALPTLGSIVGIAGRPEQDEFFLNFTSFLYPPTVFRYDFASDTLALFRGSESSFDPSQYETRQVFYPSQDGTRVPMFLTYRKGLKLDGNNPTLLYAYGGFDISLTPAFSATSLFWVESGGVYALANLRGGGEYGEEWHQAGMLEKKQNVFDDFICAAEWLIASGYTNSKRLAIQGGSNGGLLVAACMVQRPSMYGAVLCQVPVIDMLRYHRFTIGHYWIPEYGNAEANAEHFAFMYAYSPLHNVREGTVYPPTLILSADTDDRVVPAHAKKFAATLQAANGGKNPILLRVETKAGHGLGKPTTKIIEEQSDIFAFLFLTFDMKE